MAQKWNLFVGHLKSQVKKKDLLSEKQDLFPKKVKKSLLSEKKVLHNKKKQELQTKKSIKTGFT